MYVHHGFWDLVFIITVCTVYKQKIYEANPEAIKTHFKV